MSLPVQGVDLRVRVLEWNSESPNYSTQAVEESKGDLLATGRFCRDNSQLTWQSGLAVGSQSAKL
jgi:hypothetical protein